MNYTLVKQYQKCCNFVLEHKNIKKLEGEGLFSFHYLKLNELLLFDKLFLFDT
jgi:hypothetical protein